MYNHGNIPSQLRRVPHVNSNELDAAQILGSLSREPSHAASISRVASTTRTPPPARPTCISTNHHHRTRTTDLMEATANDEDAITLTAEEERDKACDNTKTNEEDHDPPPCRGADHDGPHSCNYAPLSFAGPTSSTTSTTRPIITTTSNTINLTPSNSIENNHRYSSSDERRVGWCNSSTSIVKTDCFATIKPNKYDSMTTGNEYLLSSSSAVGTTTFSRISSSSISSTKSKTFPSKLMMLLEDKDGYYSSIISWRHDGRIFTIHKPDEFITKVLPLYFKESKFPSFLRKMYRWGFSKRIESCVDIKGSPSFSHPLFIRGKFNLCEQITCSSSKCLSPSSSLGASTRKVYINNNDDMKGRAGVLASPGGVSPVASTSSRIGGYSAIQLLNGLIRQPPLSRTRPRTIDSHFEYEDDLNRLTAAVVSSNAIHQNKKHQFSPPPSCSTSSRQEELLLGYDSSSAEFRRPNHMLLNGTPLLSGPFFSSSAGTFLTRPGMTLLNVNHTDLVIPNIAAATTTTTTTRNPSTRNIMIAPSAFDSRMTNRHEMLNCHQQQPPRPTTTERLSYSNSTSSSY